MKSLKYVSTRKLYRCVFFHQPIKKVFHPFSSVLGNILEACRHPAWRQREDEEKKNKTKHQSRIVLRNLGWPVRHCSLICLSFINELFWVVSFYCCVGTTYMLLDYLFKSNTHCWTKASDPWPADLHASITQCYRVAMVIFQRFIYECHSNRNAVRLSPCKTLCPPHKVVGILNWQIWYVSVGHRGVLWDVFPPSLGSLLKTTHPARGGWHLDKTMRIIVHRTLSTELCAFFSLLIRFKGPMAWQFHFMRFFNINMSSPILPMVPK